MPRLTDGMETMSIEQIDELLPKATSAHHRAIDTERLMVAGNAPVPVRMAAQIDSATTMHTLLILRLMRRITILEADYKELVAPK